MTIYKGNDLEFHFGISPCYLDVDPSLIRNLHLDIFTAPGSTAIRKDISDISISGEIGTVHLEWEELDILEDGVIRFKLDYFYEGEEISFERSTNLYLKTPINYQPTTFITEDELEQAVAEAISGISATTVEEVEEIVDTMTADFITGTEAEQMIEDAVSGISGGNLINIRNANILTIMADLWAENSGATVDEVNGKYRFIDTNLGSVLIAVEKRNNGFVLQGAVSRSNGSYLETGFVLLEPNSGPQEFTQPCPQRLFINSSTHELSIARSILGWEGVVRAVGNSAGIFASVDQGGYFSESGAANAKSVELRVNSHESQWYRGNITITAEFWSRTDNSYVKGTWTFDYFRDGNIKTATSWELIS